MTNEITELVNQVARDARKKALNEVRDLLVAKAEMMHNVLTNSAVVMDTATGTRYQKLWEKRHRVWGRCQQLYDIVGNVYDLSQK